MILLPRMSSEAPKEMGVLLMVVSGALAEIVWPAMTMAPLLMV